MKELLILIIQNIESFEKSLKFRKGQKPFYDAIIEGLKKGWTTMFIKGPTGMGKTFIEAILAAAIIGNSDIKILLLTSKITLLKQIQREFIKFVGFISTGLFGGGFRNYHQQVTIMTYASYQRQKEAFLKQFKVLLLDEGHRGLGKLTKIQLEKQKEFSILIGFTASDEFSEKKSLTKFLVNKAHELSIIEAVELGMLSNIKVHIASVAIEISNQEKGQSKGDYEEKVSSEIIREGGNIACARLWKRTYAKKNLRGIALVLTTKQGLDLVKEFANEGIKAELIHSKLKRTEREDMFTRFKNNEFSVLVGMGIIIEGFDDPGVSVAITTYPVSSRVVMTQFPGRAERIDEENPDKVAYVVNFAYKNKNQLFYTDILDGKSEVLQKKKRKKKLDMISSSEMRAAVARNPESFITNIAVTEEEVMEIIRNHHGLDAYSQEEIIELARQELIAYGIFNRPSLLNFGVQQFRSTHFGIFGKGKSFLRIFLPDHSNSRISVNTLCYIADEFGWTYELTLKMAKEELAKKNITNRISLINFGSKRFNKNSFGIFKGSDAFRNWFLPDRIGKRTNNNDLEAIAKKLGWNDLLTLDDAIGELAKNGITNRVDLLAIRTDKFKKLDFGAFGKGRGIISWILSLPSIEVSLEHFEAIAKKLGWNDLLTLDDAIGELAKNGITNRVDLLNVRPAEFMKLKFGYFGGGRGIAGFILECTTPKRVTRDMYEKIALKLEWFDEVKTIKNALAELKKKRINSKDDLIAIGSQFKDLEFGVFGKGTAFARFVLPNDNFKYVTIETLYNISSVLKLK